MGTTVAAMKGKLGSTDYFIIAMKAKELVDKASIPSEMEGWDNLTLEEKEQRDINYNRVKKEIAYYLATDKDRFFGAIILTAKHLDSSNFEPISDIATKGLPKLYQTQAKVMGFLTFTGGEVLIPLDGQHRLKAIKYAILGCDDNNNKIANIPHPCSELANEDVTVILVPYDSKKSRKIFTRVNRYAKPTSTGQNLITDDEDFIAVSARKIANMINTIDSHSPSVDLIKTESNALGDKEDYFTTLATIAECNRAILSTFFPEPITRPFVVEDDEKRSEFMDKIGEVWKHLLENIDAFMDMLSDKTPDGDATRRDVRQKYLLGKPVPQVCLFKAYARLVYSNEFIPKEASDRLNKIDWKKTALVWDRLLFNGTRIITSNTNANIAAEIIYYMAGGRLTGEEKETLLKRYQSVFPQDPENPENKQSDKNRQLPAKVKV